MGNQSDIENKVEHAFVRHLNGISSLIPGVTMHAAVDKADLSLPHIVVQTQSAEEYPLFTGNYKVECVIEISSNAPETSNSTHASRVSRVREEIANDWVGASLGSHVADFTVHSAGVSSWGVYMGSAERTQEDDRFIHRIPVTIFCRPSD